MPLINGEEMTNLLNELGSEDLTATRRIDIITQIGAQHASGLEDQANLQSALSSSQDSVQELQLATANLLSRVNLQTFAGNEDEDEEEAENIQETITIDDLLGGK